jgi:hypothetical protein
MHFVRPPRKEVEIIGNEHVAEMFMHALQNDLELLPFLVLGFYCGIRPDGELSQVLWRDVHLEYEKSEVIIRATVSKTRRMRTIELSANAVAWLKAYRLRGGNMEGPIVRLKPYWLRTKRLANWEAAAGKGSNGFRTGCGTPSVPIGSPFTRKSIGWSSLVGMTPSIRCGGITTKARPKRLRPPSGIFIRLQSIRKMSSAFPLPKKHQSMPRPTKPERCAWLAPLLRPTSDPAAAASTALEVGHHDSRVTFARYRELVRPKEAERYWNIRPARNKKVLTIIQNVIGDNDAARPCCFKMVKTYWSKLNCNAGAARTCSCSPRNRRDARKSFW